MQTNMATGLNDVNVQKDVVVVVIVVVVVVVEEEEEEEDDEETKGKRSIRM